MGSSSSVVIMALDFGGARLRRLVWKTGKLMKKTDARDETNSLPWEVPVAKLGSVSWTWQYAP